MAHRFSCTYASALLAGFVLAGCSSATDSSQGATNPAPASPSTSVPAPSTPVPAPSTAPPAGNRQVIKTKRGYPLEVTLFPIEIGTELGDPGYTRIRYKLKITVKNQLTDRPTPAWGYGVDFYYDLSAVPFSAGPGATLGRGRGCGTSNTTTPIDGREYCGLGASLSMGSGGPDEPIAAGAELDGGVPSNTFVTCVVDDANLDAARAYLQRPSYWRFRLAPAGSGGAYGLESFRFPYTSP